MSSAAFLEYENLSLSERSRSPIVHSVHTTAANEHDVTQAHHLLHGEEKRVFADAGYQGVEKRPEHEGRDTRWYIAMRPGARRALGDSEEDIVRPCKGLKYIKYQLFNCLIC